MTSASWEGTAVQVNCRPVFRCGSVSDSLSRTEAVRGFFLIAARDDAEALEIARGCPHLRYGGRIVLRKVAPV